MHSTEFAVKIWTSHEYPAALSNARTKRLSTFTLYGGVIIAVGVFGADAVGRGPQYVPLGGAAGGHRRLRLVAAHLLAALVHLEQQVREQ